MDYDLEYPEKRDILGRNPLEIHVVNHVSSSSILLIWKSLILNKLLISNLWKLCRILWIYWVTAQSWIRSKCKSKCSITELLLYIYRLLKKSVTNNGGPKENIVSKKIQVVNRFYKIPVSRTWNFEMFLFSRKCWMIHCWQH